MRIEGKADVGGRYFVDGSIRGGGKFAIWDGIILEGLVLGLGV